MKTLILTISAIWSIFFASVLTGHSYTTSNYSMNPISGFDPFTCQSVSCVREWEKKNYELTKIRKSVTLFGEEFVTENLTIKEI